MNTKKYIVAAIVLQIMLFVLVLCANASTATTIDTADELVAIMNDSSKWNGNYKLTADIDLTGKAQKPIGNATTPFVGTFDGNGKTISGLNISGAGTVGLFGKTNGIEIRNLTLEGTVTSTERGGAGFIGLAQGNTVIENCVSKVTVNASGKVAIGGFIGDANGSITMSGCENTGAVSGGIAVGGFIGGTFNGATVTMSRCTNSASGIVTGTTKQTGGFVGVAYGKIEMTDCTNNASVTAATEEVGGFIGYTNSETIITGCTNNGAVTVNTKHVGGFIGEINGNVKIIDSVNNGAITGTASGNSRVGGFIGEMQSDTYGLEISGCINNGLITGYDLTGGFVGDLISKITIIKDSANYGNLNVTNARFGGFAGRFICRVQSGSFSFDNLYNEGRLYNSTNASKPDTYTGGIIGEVQASYANGSITNCMNAGAIVTASRQAQIGGIIGIDNKNTAYTVENVYMSGSIGTRDAIIGSKQSKVIYKNCYYFDRGEGILNKAGAKAVTADTYTIPETFTGFTDDYWVFTEIGPFLKDFVPEIDPERNLALGATVTVSSDLAGFGWAKDKLTDGDISNKNGTQNLGWTSNSSLKNDHTEWVILDLGANFNFNQVHIMPSGNKNGESVCHGFPKNFTIQVSKNKSTWDTVIAQTGYSAPAVNEMQVFVFDAVDARYVKIEATSLNQIANGGGDYRMQLSEIEVYKKAYSGPLNLALNKEVSVSSDLAGFGWAKEKLTDGDRGNKNTSGQSTGWTSNDSVKNNHTEWVVIDLGITFGLNQVHIMPGGNYAGEKLNYGFPKDFEIQISKDNINWKTVLTKSGYAVPKANEMQIFTFDTEDARYVKFEATSLNQIANGGNDYRMQLAEIEVYNARDLLSEVIAVAKSIEDTEYPTDYYSIYLDEIQAAEDVYEKNDLTAQEYAEAIDALYTAIDCLADSAIVEEENLALDKSVTVSSDINNYGWTKNKLTDGDKDNLSGTQYTGWTSDSEKNKDHAEWVVLDLGGVYKFNRLHVMPSGHHKNDSVCYGFPKSFTIYVSFDGETWSPVVSGANYKASAAMMQEIVFEQTAARYIKFEAHSLNRIPHDYNQYRMQFSEIEVYNRVNYALGKDVETSSDLANYGWDKHQIVDGDKFNKTSGGQMTGWTSDSSLSEDHTEWVVIDLDDTYSFNRVHIMPSGNKAEETVVDGFPKDFTISVSADGENWITVVDKRGYAKPYAAQMQEFVFGVVNARYMRFEATSLNQITNSGNNYRVQISEIEIYNYGAANCTHRKLEEAVTVISPNCTRPEYVYDICKNCHAYLNGRELGVDSDKHDIVWSYGKTSAIASCRNGCDYADIMEYLPTSEIHVSTKGTENGNFSAENPIADFDVAMSIAAAQDGDVTIYIHDAAIIPDNGAVNGMNAYIEPEHTNTIKIVGYNNNLGVLRFDGEAQNKKQIYNLSGPTTFDYVEFSTWGTVAEFYIVARHNKLVIDKHVSRDTVFNQFASQQLTVVGGCYYNYFSPAGGCDGLDVDITVLSGDYDNIMAGSYRNAACCTASSGGDVHLTVGGNLNVRGQIHGGNFECADMNDVYITVVGDITIGYYFGFGPSGKHNVGGVSKPYQAKNVYLNLYSGEVHVNTRGNSAKYLLGAATTKEGATARISEKLYICADSSNADSVGMYKNVLASLRSSSIDDGKWEATITENIYCESTRGQHNTSGIPTDHLDSTCISEGYDVYTCVDCGVSYVVRISKLPHTFVDATVIDATCVTPEMERVICSVCGRSEYSILGDTYADHTDPEKKGFCQICNCDLTANCEHEFGAEESFTSGCGEGTRRTCEKCGKVETNIVSEGHKYGSYFVKVEATDTAPGVKARTCKSCGKVETAIIPAGSVINAKAIATDEQGNLMNLAIENSKLTKSEKAVLNTLLQEYVYGSEVKISYETDGKNITDVTYRIPLPEEYYDYSHIRIAVRDNSGELYFVDFKVEKGYIVFTF